MLLSNTTFIKCGKLFIYNIHLETLIECKTAEKKTNDGKMLLYSNELLSCDMQQVLVIDTSRCMNSQFNFSKISLP